MSKQSKNKMKLPEQIGKGINQEHLSKVLEARKKNSTISFKIENHINSKLNAKALKMEVPKSFIIQELIKNFLNE